MLTQLFISYEESFQLFARSGELGSAPEIYFQHNQTRMDL
jgi:hypothetical protein